jgi:hypothetical protein
MDRGIKQTAEERFWAKVNKDTGTDCYEWIGSLNYKGYGYLTVDGKRMAAHRFSYLLNVGYIPFKMCILHSCDNPKCVNFDHLSVGTNADNIRDKVTKNRQYRPVGEKHPRSKLTENQVRDIKNKINLGIKQIYIAKEYKVNEATISDIKIGRSWSHVNI